MEVAKLVTQPFCQKIHVSLIARACIRVLPLPVTIAVHIVTIDGISTVAGQGKGIASKGWGEKLTWPSRVPLRMSCSAILISSSTRYRSTKSRSGGSNGESDGYRGAAIGLVKSRLEDFPGVAAIGDRPQNLEVCASKSVYQSEIALHDYITDWLLAWKPQLAAWAYRLGSCAPAALLAIPSVNVPNNVSEYKYKYFFDDNDTLQHRCNI